MDIKLCPECQLENQADSEICTHCGYKFEIESILSIRKCPYCGKDIEADAIICRHCTCYVGEGLIDKEKSDLDGRTTDIHSDEKTKHKEPQGVTPFWEWGIVGAFVVLFLIATIVVTLGAFRLAESYLTQKVSANATTNSSRLTEMAKNQETAARIAYQRTATIDSARSTESAIIKTSTQIAVIKQGSATPNPFQKTLTQLAAIKQTKVKRITPTPTYPWSLRAVRPTILALQAMDADLRATGTALASWPLGRKPIPTSSPTLESNILFPGATPVPCIRWDELTSIHIGQEICVFGVVTDFTHDYTQLLIYFPKEGSQPTTNFHITYNTNLFYNAPNQTVVEIGDCVKAYGIVVGPGEYPIMLISDDLPLPCDE